MTRRDVAATVLLLALTVGCAVMAARILRALPGFIPRPHRPYWQYSYLGQTRLSGADLGYLGYPRFMRHDAG
jgi:hypothetical protein